MTERKDRLGKILFVKKAEKDIASSEYQDAISQFESEGQELYTLLKKKEQLETTLHGRLQTGIPIDILKQQQYFIGNLEKNVRNQQRKVSHARALMNLKEEKLKEHSIECKKYEVLDDKQKVLWKQNESRIETSFIDELSILQYTHHTNR
ncbi:flagellar export protein FliJ [Sutcliffiella deserti]|uniref:flagellar export protein FliJ n=1 Tax=Sutcliffiella deserti TaxID=2875501 RepID=UPI001CBA93A8|nr:flagellar export protein FliJ [Sutcliffiella deserti]